MLLKSTGRNGIFRVTLGKDETRRFILFFGWLVVLPEFEFA